MYPHSYGARSKLYLMIEPTYSLHSQYGDSETSSEHLDSITSKPSMLDRPLSHLALLPLNIRQIIGRMKEIVDNKHRKDDCSFENIEVPFMSRQVAVHATGELDKTVNGAYLRSSQFLSGQVLQIMKNSQI